MKDPNNQGLGTSIVASLAKQLHAELAVVSTSIGTTVSLRYPQTKLF